MPKLNPDVKWFNDANASLARKFLYDFTEYTYPQYSAQWFHILLCSKLDELISGKIKKLMVFMPPQHGKTELVSRRLAAFALGKNPNLRVAVCTYAADYAEKLNRQIQRIISDKPYRILFPDTKLSERNVVTDARGAYVRNSSEFEIVDYTGGLRTVGVDGPLTGYPVDLGIIDDPVKGAVEAHSQVDQKRKWEWYCDVFSQRLHNESRVLLTMTRWHRKDLAGMILDYEPGLWTILKLPYLKTTASTIPEDKRLVGEALWEDRHSAAKAALSKTRSPQTFSALAQQEPVIEGGNLIRIDKVHLIGGVCPACGEEHDWPDDIALRRAWDMASSTKELAKDDPDLTVGVLGGMKYIDSSVRDIKIPILYIKDVVRGQWEASMRNDIILQTAIGDGEGVTCGIEAFAAYKDAYTTIRDILSGIRVVEPMRLPGDKIAKASALAPIFLSGNIYLQRAAWNDEYLDCLASFPSGGHDDDVDATAVLYHMCKQSGVGDIYTTADMLEDMAREAA